MPDSAGGKQENQMGIVYHESSRTFHLYNDAISYIMIILKNGHLGQLYYGKRIRDREDFSYFLETSQRPMTARVFVMRFTKTSKKSFREHILLSMTPL